MSCQPWKLRAPVVPEQAMPVNSTQPGSYLPGTRRDLTENQQRLSITEMRKAIRHAGYLLDIDTATKLRNIGFRVETNPPYPDRKTGIQRGIDLFASHADLFLFGSRPDDWLCPVVAAECKKSKTPITLLTTEWSRDFETDGHERWEALQIVRHPRLARVTQDENCQIRHRRQALREHVPVLDLVS